MDKNNPVFHIGDKNFPAITLGQEVWTNFRLVDTEAVETDEPCKSHIVFICFGQEYSYCMIEFPTSHLYPVFFDQIGSMIFPSREDAISALEKQKNRRDTDEAIASVRQMP